MPKNKIYIPTFISSVTYAPARVLPHVYFYNGLKACETYYLQGYTNGNTGSVTSNALESFPYFDNYEGQDPTSGSRSLLFFNEPAVYGTTPTGSLYSDYWETYISLLYNPRTRLINCEAIIPLADYFKMELNDIVEWRGNYYHLRAINNYNLSNGECSLQLLGPILGDILPKIIPSIACDFNYTLSGPCSQSYAVGQSALGGIVAYVDETGCNGFVVSTGSIGTYEWGCPSTSSIIEMNSTMENIGYGWLATQKILGQCTQRPIAASIADGYTSAGFSNWCLPTYYEIQQIAINKNLINAGGGDITGRAWSSFTYNDIHGTGKLLAVSWNLDANQALAGIRDESFRVYAIQYFGNCFTSITTTTTTCAPSGSTTTTTLPPTTTTTVSPTTTTIAPTTTTTTIGYYLYGNCGQGNTVAAACNDAVNNARNFYSDCSPGTFGGGCFVYTDTFGTLLLGYSKIFMNGSNWDVNPLTGVITGPSSQQC